MKKVTEYLQYLFDFFWHNFKKKYSLSTISYIIYHTFYFKHPPNFGHVSLLDSELQQLRSFPRSGRPGAAGRRLTRCLLQLSISVSECIPALSTANAAAARFPQPWDEHLAINTSTTFDHVLLQLEF